MKYCNAIRCLLAIKSAMQLHYLVLWVVFYISLPNEIAGFSPLSKLVNLRKIFSSLVVKATFDPKGGDAAVKYSRPQRWSKPAVLLHSNYKNREQNGSSDSWKELTNKLKSTRASESQQKAFGKEQKLQQSGDGKDELQCKHFESCSGCVAKSEFDDTHIMKRARYFFLSQDVDMKIHLGKATGWRSHVKLAVQPMSKWGGLNIGLFKAGSHVVEPIPDCRVHHPRINEAVEVLRRSAVEAGVRGYLPAGGRGKEPQGELRYIQLSMDRSSKRIQLVLVWNSLSYKQTSQALPRLIKKLKKRSDLWHSIAINFHSSDSNAIFNFSPKAWQMLWGPPLMREIIGNASFFFQPQIFRQANLDSFESGIIPLVLSKINEGASIAELYSGIGLVGLNAAAAQAKEVFCSDSNPFIEGVFDKCADSLPENKQDRVFFECMEAEDAVAQGQCDLAQVLIVDPPRKGLDSGVLQLLQGKHPLGIRAEGLERVIYISCGFEALERDTRALISSGKWIVSSADGFVLFPGSDHLESVVVFDRLQPNLHTGKLSSSF